MFTGEWLWGKTVGDETLDVNICKAKQLSNMRASGSDEALVLTPPRQITLEYALEYIGTDELGRDYSELHSYSQALTQS